MATRDDRLALRAGGAGWTAAYRRVPTRSRSGTAEGAADLARAGIAARDEDNRVLDCHAFGHTFCTRLAKGGIPAKVAQTLARHSTVTLTLDNYAHVGIADEAQALEALQSLVLRQSALRATGTDGRHGRATP